MDWNFLGATSMMLVINLVYAVVTLFVGVAAIRILDRTILKKIDLEEEIRSGNIAAAIFAATLLLFVAIIMAGAVGK